MELNNHIKIGLDVDGVLANFSEAVIRRARKMGLADEFPKTHEHIDNWDVAEKFSHVMRDAWADPNFWLGLKPLTKVIPFKVDCYITARRIPSEVTRQWLKNNNFPDADVISVKNPDEKLHHITERQLDLFVDDYYVTITQLLEKGVNALLFVAPYQRGHEEECRYLPKVHSLEDVLNYVR